MLDNVKKYQTEIVVALGLLIMLAWALPTLTTKPKIWIDEAVPLENARNMYLHGRLNALPAPGVWYAQPYLLQQTGYPVTLSLAAFFKVFGYGFTQARAAMLVWICIALVTLFAVVQSLFTKELALWSFLLVISFASFYANGRPTTGEIPGFVFLLLALYFWLRRSNVWLTGFLMGFAVVSKPSVYQLLIPAITLTLLLQQKPFIERFKDILRVGISMLPAALLWVVFVVPQPFSLTTWQTIAAFFAHPFGTTAEVARLCLFGHLAQKTLLYFAVWIAVLIAAFRTERDSRIRLFYWFTFIYGAFAFLYYLRSPGWLHYILIAELLILTLLPHALKTLLEKYGHLIPASFLLTHALALVICAIALFQIVQLNTVAKLYTSDSVIRTAAYINEHYPHESVATIGTLTVSTLLETENRYIDYNLLGVPRIGSNPLVMKPLPLVIVADESTDDYLKAEKALADAYIKVTTIDIFGVYEVKK